MISRGALRAQGPRRAPTLNAVTVKLTDDALREMNGAVDIDGQEPADVASRFLRDHDLL